MVQCQSKRRRRNFLMRKKENSASFPQNHETGHVGAANNFFLIYSFLVLTLTLAQRSFRSVHSNKKLDESLPLSVYKLFNKIVPRSCKSSCVESGASLGVSTLILQKRKKLQCQ